MNIFIFILYFVTVKGVLFKNRIFTIGSNSEEKLCDRVYPSFDESSKHQITNFPAEGEKAVKLIVSNNVNAFFLLENGEVYGSGEERYWNGDSSGETTYVPQEISFPSPISFISASDSFSIFCSSSFEECFGIGSNEGCRYAGCSDTSFASSPRSIFTDDLSIFLLSSPSSILNVFVGVDNTVILLQNSTEEVLFGTGTNSHLILSIGTNNSENNYQSWTQMNISSLSNTSGIKFFAIFNYFTTFIVTKEDRWFFSGFNQYSGCFNQFNRTLHTPFFTELPQNACFCDEYENEAFGKKIIDLQCAEVYCVALSNESKLYSWGDISSSQSLGRFVSNWTENYSFAFTPMEVPNLWQPNNQTNQIIDIYVKRYNTFILLTNKTENRKRIFATGRNQDFDFQTYKYHQMFEVFGNYSFTSYLTLSKGNFQRSSLFLHDTSICWGEYTNASVNPCNDGVCYDFDECLCDEGYTGRRCELSYCFGILSTNTNESCNGKGACVGYDTCDCDFQQSEGGVSPNCTYSICFGSSAADPSVCSSRGKCIGADYCRCDDGYHGDSCDLENTNSVALFFGITIPAVLITSVLITLCAIVLIVLLLVVVAAILVPFFVYFFKNRKNMQKFSSLKNVDLLLKEQELDDRVDIAHVKINEGIFNLNIDDIELLDLVGSGGSQSKVYKAKFKGELYAFKLFKAVSFDSVKMFEEFEREVSVLGSFRHKNILGFFGACIKAPRVGILMEYCENGDLKNFLKNYKEKKDGRSYPMNEKLRMIKEVASAMNHLHLSKIIHRDIKLENVLVDDYEVTKLMDFGLSRGMGRDSATDLSLTRGIGTSFYMSPELIRGEEYDWRVDIYAFGILCFIVLSEQYQCYGENEEGVEYKVANNPFFRPKLNEIDGMSWIKKLIKRCWDHKASNRPSFRSVLKFLEKKKDESVVVYYLFCDSLESVQEDEAEDFLLKEKTLEGLKEIITKKEERTKEEDFSIHLLVDHNEKVFKQLTSDKDVMDYLVDDCLICFTKKKKEVKVARRKTVDLEKLKKELEEYKKLIVREHEESKRCERKKEKYEKGIKSFSEKNRKMEEEIEKTKTENLQSRKEKNLFEKEKEYATSENSQLIEKRNHLKRKLEMKRGY